jgi:hypothetical protein
MIDAFDIIFQGAPVMDADAPGDFSAVFQGAPLVDQGQAITTLSASIEGDCEVIGVGSITASLSVAMVGESDAVPSIIGVVNLSADIEGDSSIETTMRTARMTAAVIGISDMGGGAFRLSRSITLPIFTIPPDWSETVVVRTLYKTIIREALETSEERQTLRPRCLYGIGFRTVGLTMQETGYLRRLLELAQASPIGMPVWTEATRLTAAAAEGDTVIAVDDISETLWSIVGDYALAWTAFNDWELLEVQSIANEAITLSSPGLGSALPAGTKILPVIFGNLPRAGQRPLTDANGVFAVNFEERFNGIANQTA